VLNLYEESTDELRKGVLKDAKGIDEEVFGMDFYNLLGLKEKK
jgi:hypothetical protein